MPPENDRQRQAGKYALRKMLELANLMTDSGRKGRVLKNRVAENDRVFAREIHVSANPDVARQCADANMENVLVDMVREAFRRRRIRIFHEGLKRLGKLHIFESLEDRLEYRDDAEYMRRMEKAMDDFLSELAPENRRIITREMGKVAEDTPEASVCLRVTAGILDNRFSEAVFQAGIGKVGRKVSGHRAIPNADGIKKAIDTALCGLFRPVMEESPAPAGMRM